ncbi:FlaA1/EpsC-like NDP-sugar epimerase [Elusimicrobium simillimum]|uniref:hypothetical protein n=1 Tax=Elusimicrobium simillimum TaxID=3143438 RepID=UPI003C6F0F10
MAVILLVLLLAGLYLGVQFAWPPAVARLLGHKDIISRSAAMTLPLAVASFILFALASKLVPYAGLLIAGILTAALIAGAHMLAVYLFWQREKRKLGFKTYLIIFTGPLIINIFIFAIIIPSFFPEMFI